MLFTEKQEESYEHRKLKCENCGSEFINFEEETLEDFESVDETGLCLSCLEEIDVKLL